MGWGRFPQKWESSLFVGTPPGVQAVVMNPGFIWVPIAAAPPRKGWLDAWLEELHGLARKAAAAAAGGDSQR